MNDSSEDTTIWDSQDNAFRAATSYIHWRSPELEESLQAVRQDLRACVEALYELLAVVKGNNLND